MRYQEFLKHRKFSVEFFRKIHHNCNFFHRRSRSSINSSGSVLIFRLEKGPKVFIHAAQQFLSCRRPFFKVVWSCIPSSFSRSELAKKRFSKNFEIFFSKFWKIPKFRPLALITWPLICVRQKIFDAPKNANFLTTTLIHYSLFIRRNVFSHFDFFFRREYRHVPERHSSASFDRFWANSVL